MIFFFFYKILAKYSPKRTIFKNFSGEHTPEPPYQTRAHFSKNILNPPPPLPEMKF